MEKRLLITLEDYQKIQETLREIRLLTEKGSPIYHKTLYIGNTLFESTHDFETGLPCLHQCNK